MIAIVLAAGYATRMYPLTKNYPKPLLLVSQKPIIEYITDELDSIKEISDIYVVTNNKFYTHFTDWKKTLKYNKNIHIINDLTNDNDTRLGALKDIRLVLDRVPNPEVALITAADNLFTFKLKDLVDAYKKVNRNIVLSIFEDKIEKLRKTGVAEIKDNKIISFEEKPKVPKGNYAIPPFYLYKSTALEILKKYVEEGYPSDAPGSFIGYLIKHEDIYTIPMNGVRYDVGDLEAYNQIRLTFKK